MISSRCGICGDPWDESPREHEAGGKYANGIITRKYSPGQDVKVTVDLTANHKVGTAYRHLQGQAWAEGTEKYFENEKMSRRK